MKNNYTAFIANLEMVSHNSIRFITRVVYKTDCNKFFIREYSDDIIRLVEIKEDYIIHVYG